MRLVTRDLAGVPGKRSIVRCARPGEGTLEEVLSDLLRECDVATERVAAELRVVRRLLKCAVAA